MPVGARLSTATTARQECGGVFHGGRYRPSHERGCRPHAGLRRPRSDVARGPRPRGLREHAALSASPPTTSCRAGSPSWSASSARSPVNSTSSWGRRSPSPTGRRPRRSSWRRRRSSSRWAPRPWTWWPTSGWLKDRRYELYEGECREHIALCHAAGINGKVIIEAGHLSDEELVAATRMVVAAGADFVKTATGTDPAGFPGFHQVRLILETLREANARHRTEGVRARHAPRRDGLRVHQDGSAPHRHGRGSGDRRVASRRAAWAVPGSRSRRRPRTD